MKTVSVIIAAYKAEAFIQEAIDSVLGQQLPVGYRLQLILGIDACESTARAVADINDERIEVYCMQANQGTYVTFNTMMQFAKGDFIVRFDADDIMLEGYLARQLKLLENDPETYLTWTRNRYVDEAGHALPGHEEKYSAQLKRWERRAPSHGQFMMRKALWEALGGFRSWRCNGDTDLLFRMRFLGYKEEAIHEVLYLRRIHPNSLTQSPETGYGSDMRKAIREKMHHERETRSTKEECYIAPVTAAVAPCPGPA